MTQQAQINPVEVSNFLAKEAQKMGAKLYANTRVQQLNIPQNNLYTEKICRFNIINLFYVHIIPLKHLKGLNF